MDVTFFFVEQSNNGKFQTSENCFLLFSKVFETKLLNLLDDD